ncbi:MAG: DUF4156 domain-containing protein [Pseudomarimonas sp.]
MIRNRLFAALTLGLLGACTLSACTWVKLEPEGQATRVASEAEDLSYCEKRGGITVSVKHNVGFIERNALKVQDELETMARNEALSMAADTVRADDVPLYGEQRFTAYACRNKTATPTAAPPAPARQSGEAETFPVPSR